VKRFESSLLVGVERSALASWAAEMVSPKLIITDRARTSWELLIGQIVFTVLGNLAVLGGDSFCFALNEINPLDFRHLQW
jgi:hypothetical protein